MAKLSEIILEQANHEAMIADCVQVVESRVKATGGLSGMALKSAFSLLCKMKPGMLNEVMARLLPRFAEALDPFYAEHGNTGVGFAAALDGRSEEVANALLQVTDERAASTEHGTLRKAYEKLRPTALKHTQAAVPELAAVLEKHLLTVEGGALAEAS